nr:unnamed protein product [Callosobruchus analis]
MGEDRLVGLALLNIHRDIDVDVDVVITRFSKGSKTKLEFVLQFLSLFCIFNN